MLLKQASLLESRSLAVAGTCTGTQFQSMRAEGESGRAGRELLMAALELA
jgi:hypothetical protein